MCSYSPAAPGSPVRQRFFQAAPHNSARSLRQDFCSNSKFRKWRNTVCISHFRNCGSGAKRRLRLADAIVRCCPNSRFKWWGYHEIKQKVGSLVDISHRQVYCSALCDSIISKLSKKPKVLLNGFLTKYLLTWQKTPSVRLPWAARTCCSAIRPKVPKPVRWYTPWWKAQGKRSRTICLSTACAGGSPIPGKVALP